MHSISKQQASFNYMRYYCREADNLLRELDMTSERKWIPSDDPDAAQQLRYQCGAVPVHLRGAKCSACDIALIPELPADYHDLDARVSEMRERQEDLMTRMRAEITKLTDLLGAMEEQRPWDEDLMAQVAEEISRLQAQMTTLERDWQQQHVAGLHSCDRLLTHYKRLREQQLQQHWAVERVEYVTGMIGDHPVSLLCQACAVTRLLQREDRGAVFYRRAVFEYKKHEQLQLKHTEL